jgi:hypothetical protein
MEMMRGLNSERNMALAGILSSSFPVRHQAEAADTFGPEITRAQNQITVRWRRSRALHQLPLELTPLTVVFPAVEGEQSHELRYKIFSENIRTPVEGSLLITTYGERKVFDLHDAE